MNKIGIVRTGFITQRNINHLISDIKLRSQQNIDTYIFTWDVDSTGTKLDNSLINQLQLISKGVYIHKYDEYEKNKTLHTLKKENREIEIDMLMKMSPRDVNNLWGTEQKFIPEAKLEFFEYWLNRLKDQYYTVSKGIKVLESLGYDYVLRVRSDINAYNLPIYLENGIHVPYCRVHGHKDHIVQGDIESMVKYSKLYDVINEIYPIKEKDFSMQNQCAECLLKYYISETEPKIKFNIYTDFLEHKNYQIIK